LTNFLSDFVAGWPTDGSGVSGGEGEGGPEDKEVGNYEHLSAERIAPHGIQTRRGELAVERGSGVTAPDPPESPCSTSSPDGTPRPHQRAQELVFRARGFTGGGAPSSPDESGSSGNCTGRPGMRGPSGNTDSARRVAGRAACAALRQAGNISNNGELSARVMYLRECQWPG
jgi:hypothetical protein